MKRRKKTTENKERKEVDLQMRTATLEIRAEEGKETIVRMSVSSEVPVLVWTMFNDTYQRVYEILDHSETSIDLSRAKGGLVILDRHFGDQIGLMDVKISDRKLDGPVRFGAGERSQEIAADAKAGIRSNVSVGYQVDASQYRTEGEKDGIPVVRAMSWTPYEASFEPVPADPTVGVGRSAKDTQKNKAEKKPSKPEQEERAMTPKEIAALFARAAKYGIEISKVEPLIEQENARGLLDEMIVEKQASDADATRTEIENLKNRKPEAPEKTKVVPGPDDNKEIKKELRRYSVMNVIRSLAGQKVDIGREREMSDELARLRGKDASGIIIPHAALSQRDFTVSGTSSATVETDLKADEFIDLLRTKTILAPLGVRFLSGLVGNVAIPKMTAGATGYWVTEGGDITESEPTLGQVTGTPHTCGVLTDISRRMLIQSTPDAEMLVRDEIVERIARTIQIAVFAGSGAAGQPSAITNATGINNPSVTQGTPTYAEMLGFVSAIMADNAQSDGQKWAGTAEVWAKLADTDVDSGSGQKVLDPKTNKMLGRDFLTSEDLPANSLWLGGWGSVVVGVWGSGIDLTVDTATLSASGGVRLVGLQDVDVMVRLGQALAYNTAVTS